MDRPDRLLYVYFRTAGLVSAVPGFEVGALAETAVIGSESLRGIAVFMGGDSVLDVPSSCAPATRSGCAHTS